MAIQSTPTSRTPERESVRGLEHQGLAPTGRVHWNLVAPELMQAAIRRDEGELADMGPFVAITAPHTGRSPNDKFVVRESSSEQDVDWGKVNQPLADEHFERLLEASHALALRRPTGRRRLNCHDLRVLWGDVSDQSPLARDESED